MRDLMTEPGIIFLLGGLGGVIYIHLIRPVVNNLIKRLKSRWYMYTSARLTNAESRGYGWAWAAVMVEANSLDSVRAVIRPSISPIGKPQSAFERGVFNAIDDIEHFECLKEERT